MPASSNCCVENGRVTGVVIDKNGADWRIGARLGVLINAGGFSRNQRMLDQYIPGTSTEWTTTAPGDTGEMIEEAVRIGAAIAQMDERVGNPDGAAAGRRRCKPVVVQGDMAKPHAIVVDQTGVRYMRESASYMEIGQAMLERNAVAPAIPSWLVVDSQYLEKYMLAGTMPGAKKPKPWTADEVPAQRRIRWTALAAACGMDAASLRASVERFNGFARKRAGRGFPARRPRLLPLAGRLTGCRLAHAGHHRERPVLRACKCIPAMSAPLAALSPTNTRACCARTAAVIPGLYATGTSTASVMGRVAPGAGGSIGPSFTWGYVAAKHAAGSAIA